MISQSPEIGDKGGLAVAPRGFIEVGGQKYDYYGFVARKFNSGFWHSWKSDDLNRLWKYLNEHPDGEGVEGVQ